MIPLPQIIELYLSDPSPWTEAGDKGLEDIMLCLGNDAKGKIRSEIAKLVALEHCSEAQAAAALLMAPILL